MIVCEVGLNHLGKEEYANDYVDKAIQCNIDALTFYIGDEQFYQQEKFSNFKLSDDFYFTALKKLRENNIKFGVMISDISKIDFFEKIKTDFYKVFSNDINNHKLISRLKQTNKKIFVSTGMSDLEEIEKLVNFIDDSKDQFTLIHTQLTNKLDHVNLKAIPMLRKKFDMNIAFGNHANNINVLYVVLGYEPSDLFFYIKGNMVDHPDEPHAVKLDNLDELIKNLRELPRSIGKEVKMKIENEIVKEK